MQDCKTTYDLSSQNTGSQYFLWIDLLGFKDYIARMRTDKSLEQKLINFLKSIQKKHLNSPQITRVDKCTVAYDLPAMLLSDTLMISFPIMVSEEINKSLPNKFHQPYNVRSVLSHAFCTVNEIYLKALFDLGLLVRGCLHYGEIYMAPPILFGQGIIDAYELEHEICMPAICISPAIMENEEDNNVILNSEYSKLFTPYKNNGYDGYYFKPSTLTHIDNISKANSIIDLNLSSNLKEEHLSKWKWIRDVINSN